MSVSIGQSQVLLTAGIVCVVAAIVGGGVTYKDFAIPKILSPKRQLLLGGFGALLILTALEFIFRVLSSLEGAIPFVLAALLLWGITRANAREKKYKEMFIAHRDRPKELVDDAERAFWEGSYKWTIKYASQAKAATRDDDTWESGYAFLLGASLALRYKDAARTTGTEIIDSVKKAANDKIGYFSSRESLRQLASNLAAVKTEITKDGIAKKFAVSLLPEIDRVLKVVNDVLHPAQ
jgi:hypothetical protein